MTDQNDGIQIGRKALQPAAIFLALMLSGGSLLGVGRLSLNEEARPDAWTATQDREAMRQQSAVFTAQLNAIEQVNREMVASLRAEVTGMREQLTGLRNELRGFREQNSSYYGQVVPGMHDIRDLLKALQNQDG